MGSVIASWNTRGRIVTGTMASGEGSLEDAPPGALREISCGGGGAKGPRGGGPCCDGNTHTGSVFSFSVCESAGEISVRCGGATKKGPGYLDCGRETFR